MIPCLALRAGQCQHPCPVGEKLGAAGTGNRGVLGRQQGWQLCSAPGMAQAGRRSSSFRQDRKQHPWASRFFLPVLSSIRLRNGHCRVGGYQPMALWPQFPPCHAGGHGASNLPFLPTLSSCCRTWLFPYSVRMGPKEVEQGWRSSPQPVSPHPQEPPLPTYPCSRGRGPCRALLSRLALLWTLLPSVWRLCGSEQWSLVPACAWFHEHPTWCYWCCPRSLPCLWFQQHVVWCWCRSGCGFDVT